MGLKPKYMEIYDWIKIRIDRCELKAGDKIYSENELMQKFSVSRQTVRHAISRLEFDHLVIRKRGSGTYINDLSDKDTPGFPPKQLAVVTTYIDEYIFPKIIKSIEKEVFKEGYSIQIASTHNSIEKERLILSKLVEEHMISGLIIEAVKSALPNPNVSLYRELRKQGIPVVFLNAYYPDLSVPHVSMDDRQAGKAATKFVIDKGHREIGAIFKADDRQGHLRYLGYIEALMEAGIKVREENILWITTGDAEEMEKEKNRYLQRLKSVTACVCYNDTIAADLINVCLSNDILIPEDLSVMGIDDADNSKDLTVPLSTVHNPLQMLGKLSAQLIMRMIKGQKVDESYELKAAIVERKSVKECMK